MQKKKKKFQNLQNVQTTFRLFVEGSVKTNLGEWHSPVKLQELQEYQKAQADGSSREGAVRFHLLENAGKVEIAGSWSAVDTPRDRVARILKDV